MLTEIEKTIEALNAEGEKPSLAAARAELVKVFDRLNGLKVQGYEDVDRLLGCMMYIKQILGEEGENG